MSTHTSTKTQAWLDYFNLLVNLVTMISAIAVLWSIWYLTFDDLIEIIFKEIILLPANDDQKNSSKQNLSRLKWAGIIGSLMSVLLILFSSVGNRSALNIGLSGSSLEDGDEEDSDDEDDDDEGRNLQKLNLEILLEEENRTLTLFNRRKSSIFIQNEKSSENFEDGKDQTQIQNNQIYEARIKQHQIRRKRKVFFIIFLAIMTIFCQAITVYLTFKLMRENLYLQPLGYWPEIDSENQFFENTQNSNSLNSLNKFKDIREKAQKSITAGYECDNKYGLIGCYKFVEENKQKLCQLSCAISALEDNFKCCGLGAVNSQKHFMFYLSSSEIEVEERALEQQIEQSSSLSESAWQKLSHIRLYFRAFDRQHFLRTSNSHSRLLYTNSTNQNKISKTCQKNMLYWHHTPKSILLQQNPNFNSDLIDAIKNHGPESCDNHLRHIGSSAFGFILMFAGVNISFQVLIVVMRTKIWNSVSKGMDFLKVRNEILDSEEESKVK